MTDDRTLLERAARAAVRPLTEDSPVLVSISGRLEVLPMTWLRARDLYVRHFGIDGIQDCREALESCGHWRGYSDPEKRTWLAIVRAAAALGEP